MRRRSATSRTSREPVLIDSSAWIEFFQGGDASSSLDVYVAHPNRIIVPALVLYEVYRFLLKSGEEAQAILLLAHLKRGDVRAVDEEIAQLAAELSLKHRLGTADSVILATARICAAKLVTLDNDFRGIQGCEVLSGP